MLFLLFTVYYLYCLLYTIYIVYCILFILFTVYYLCCLLYTVYIYCSILFTAHKEKLEVLALFTGLSSVCCLQNKILLLKFYK